jgi:50S ribosomal subunit-associated GTPase HflX
LAVGDVTRPETADALAVILDRFMDVCPEATVINIANKIDLQQDTSDYCSRIAQFTPKLKSDLLLTSAKTGERVEEAFCLLSREIENPHDERIDES